MKREPGRLTPYLASLLRLGGPRCERDFLGHEHRSLLKGAPPANVASLRGRMEQPDEPEPAPRILRLRRKAA
jgi:hypothetical protein